MSIVEAQGVHKSYGAVEVLKGVSFAIEPGQVVAIIGRSGSGKSTMLRCLNGLETINAGNITVAGHKLDHDRKRLLDLRRDVGMVFQSYNLFPHLTVGENIALAPSIVKKLAASKIDGIVDQVLTQVGLLDKKDCYPEQLSGGQQQRVAIARSLAMEPKVMLFDEVTSALDPELTAEVLRVMENLAASGMTMVLVTHEMEFARRMAHTTIFMHQGKVHEAGPSKALFAQPRTPELQQFLSAGALK
ncbi:amino acid ABC transporter ATP-binding protein [Cupriavidus necator]|uniref:Amino acid ABC transporter ATP-binding protein n=1 Tax=Cupriavidus necator TaxID=106590 RepID=A0A367PQA0_CUPNE|nr:amino acid ABC transporter ATP-binding protein [Cupriavidus necator]QQX86500.1 amino acid ABC transporter ATP-binding protein [Cupriavidus necator]RCJ10080.1 amino acid ABC transporter ATP-binding protein [Cupriavidus necator]